MPRLPLIFILLILCPIIFAIPHPRQVRAVHHPHPQETVDEHHQPHGHVPHHHSAADSAAFCSAALGPGPALCDPDGLLSVAERRSIRQRLRQLALDTANLHAKGACARRGLSLSILVAERRTGAIEQARDTLLENNRRRGPWPSCPRAIFVVIPIRELDHMSVFHTSDLALNGRDIYRALTIERPLLRQGRYLEALTGMMSELRLLALYGPREPNPDPKPDSDPNQQDEEHNNNARERQAMSRTFLLLVAFSAVLCALGLSLAGFGLFYYVAIVRHGGLSCWGDGAGGNKRPRMANGAKRREFKYYLSTAESTVLGEEEDYCSTTGGTTVMRSSMTSPSLGMMMAASNNRRTSTP